MNNKVQGTFFDYDGFCEKFEPKKTTDDCYTPQDVYEAVKGWAFKRYGLADDTTIARPFWPGGNYESHDYPAGCVVLDNPPFSILGKIVKFYLQREIRFFLFAPALTLFSSLCNAGVNAVVCGANIIYKNKAKIPTSFLTDMGENRFETAPDLYKEIMEVQKETSGTVSKYNFPDCVVTAAGLHTSVAKGVRMSVPKGECVFIRKLDGMRRNLFGGGLLLSVKAVKAVKAETIQLSDREMEIQRMIGANR